VIQPSFLRAFSYFSTVSIVTAIAVVIQLPLLTGDPGVGWHLMTGRWIVENGLVPTADPFLTTSASKGLIATQWLSDVFFWTVFEQLGFQGLNAVVLSLACITFFYFVGNVAVLSRPSLLALVAGLLFGMAAWSIQLFIRPVMFSFLLFAVLLLIVHRWNEDSKDRSFGLAATSATLFILWANLHPGFAVGLLVLGALVAQEFVKLLRRGEHRSLVAVLALAGAAGATFVNPYGADLHRNIGFLVGNDFFLSLMAEWKSPDFQDATFSPFLFQLLALLLLGMITRVRVSAFEGIVILVLSMLALESRRFIPFFAIASTPLLVRGLDQLGREYVVRLLPSFRRWFSPEESISRLPFPVGCVVLTIVLSLTVHGPIERSINGFSEWRPVAALQSIEADGGSGAIFHSPNHGGLITFSSYPVRRAWIDDRNELNGEEIYREYFELHGLRDGWREVLAKYQFEYLLLDLPSPLAVALRELGGWKELYRDARNVVLKRMASDSL
jgi:hypothetical protein